MAGEEGDAHSGSGLAELGGEGDAVLDELLDVYFALGNSGGVCAPQFRCCIASRSSVLTCVRVRVRSAPRQIQSEDGSPALASPGGPAKQANAGSAAADAVGPRFVFEDGQTELTLPPEVVEASAARAATSVAPPVAARLTSHDGAGAGAGSAPVAAAAAPAASAAATGATAAKRKRSARTPTPASGAAAAAAGTAGGAAAPAASSRSSTRQRSTASKRGGRASSGGRSGGSRRNPRKRFLWTDALHRRFVSAIFDHGLKSATPRILFELMQNEENGGEVPKMTAENIKSHLQKYRKNSAKSRAQFLADYDKALEAARRQAEEESKATGQPAFPPHFSTYPQHIPADSAEHYPAVVDSDSEESDDGAALSAKRRPDEASARARALSAGFSVSEPMIGFDNGAMPLPQIASLMNTQMHMHRQMLSRRDDQIASDILASSPTRSFNAELSRVGAGAGASKGVGSASLTDGRDRGISATSQGLGGDSVPALDDGDLFAFLR